MSWDGGDESRIAALQEQLARAEETIRAMVGVESIGSEYETQVALLALAYFEAKRSVNA